MFFEQGLGGLSAAEQNLNIIGKNIANGNTNGYKASSIDFANVLADTLNSPNTGQSITAASGPLTGNVTQSFTQGPISGTSNPLDIAINGKGFFQLQDPVTGKLSYTRDGAFKLNGNNQIENAIGLLLTGYTAGVQGGKAAPIDLSKYQRSTGALSATITPTTNLAVSSPIIPAASFNPTDPATYNYSTSTSGLDNVGRPYTLQMFYAKDNASTVSTSVYNVYTSYSTPPSKANTILAGQAFFDSTGVVTKVIPNAPVTKTAGTNTLSGIPIGQPPGFSQMDIDTITASVNGTSGGLTNGSGITKKNYVATSPPWTSAAALTPSAAALAATAAINNSSTLTDKQISDFGFYIQNQATSYANKITPTTLAGADPAVETVLQSLSTLAGFTTSLSPSAGQAINALGSPPPTPTGSQTPGQAMAAAIIAEVSKAGSGLSGNQITSFTNAINVVANQPFASSNTGIVQGAVLFSNAPGNFSLMAMNAVSDSTALTMDQKNTLSVAINGFSFGNATGSTAANNLIAALNTTTLPVVNAYTSQDAINAVLADATGYTIGSAQSVSLSLDNITQSGQTSQTTAMSNTSTTVGTLENFSIGNDGSITGIYSNSQTENIGFIALANFTSTAGLKQDGNNSWVATPASGQAIVGAPTSGGLGTLQASALEGSNEDQTSDMVALLAAQRAYQANAQTVKAQDQMAQALLNL